MARPRVLAGCCNLRHLDLEIAKEILADVFGEYINMMKDTWRTLGIISGLLLWK
jgi:hypothetical protein